MYTKGKWEVKDIPSHGFEIFAEVNMGSDERGGVLQPIYNVDIQPYIKVGKDGKASVMIAYESWRQFPSINFENMQRANAHLIAASPRMAKLLNNLLNISFSTDDENYDEVSPLLEEAQEILNTVEV